MRRFVLAIACIAMTVVMAEQLHAGVIITYHDDEHGLYFDFAGSLSVATGATMINDFTTVSQQTGVGPVFYSATAQSTAQYNSSVAHTAGIFATGLQNYVPEEGVSLGTSFMFKLHYIAPGPATQISLWGDWGPANAPINGQLFLPGQTVLGIGMVDGWSAQTDWGTITFRDAASVSTVPEPTSLAIFGIGALGLVASRRRRKDKVDLV